jgi:septum site-determining protein MinC
MSDLVAPIRIKGLRDGLLVSLPAGEWGQQRIALLSQIDTQSAFFQGARLALDVGTQVLKVNELVELRDRLSERNVSLWAVLSESPATEQTAQLLGLATRVSKPRPEELESMEAGPVADDTALFVNRTLRSGTRIEHSGTVLVMGDVNPGAEIVAAGSIIVWGRLRGSVHAGSEGDEQAVVCGLDVRAMRLQIAGETYRTQSGEEPGGPEIARIKEGAVEVESWQPAGMGST